MQNVIIFQHEDFSLTCQNGVHRGFFYSNHYSSIGVAHSTHFKGPTKLAYIWILKFVAMLFGQQSGYRKYIVG